MTSNWIIFGLLLLAMVGASIAAIDAVSEEHTTKSDNNGNNVMPLDYVWSPSMEIVGKDVPPIVRYIRGSNGFVRFGRSGSAFVRFGRDNENNASPDQPEQSRSTRQDQFVRFGRSRPLLVEKVINEQPKIKHEGSYSFLRFGRYNDNNGIRFHGKRSGLSATNLHKLPENIDLLNEIAAARNRASLDRIDTDQTMDNELLEELLRSQGQTNSFPIEN